MKLPVKPAKEHEHKGPIVDEITELSEGAHHRLLGAGKIQ
jgi:hypothetical protein